MWVVPLCRSRLWYFLSPLYGASVREAHYAQASIVNSGVPQGSILRPKLFILYLNDICTVSEIVKFILFADDTHVFHYDHDNYKQFMYNNEQ